MSLPIQKEHELICPCGCGCVVLVLEERPIKETRDSYDTISYNNFLLGTALSQNIKYAKPRTERQTNEENVLRRLIAITTEFNIPERIAFETLNQLKRKNRGFKSQKEPIKELIKILSKDDNYLHINKLRKIKVKYAEILSR